MAIKTLNQIVSRIKTLALSHSQVGSFFSGEEDDAENLQDLKYVAVKLISVSGGQISKTAKTKVFLFEMYVIDLVHVAEDTKENQPDVMSDTELVASDILALINHPKYQFDWELSETSTINPVIYQGGDMAAGHQVSFSISIPWLSNACEAPAAVPDFENEFDMAQMRLYQYTASGTEESSFPVPFLSGKRILAVFRSGYYRRPAAAIPTNYEMIQVGTTLLANNKGVEGNGQVVLITGDIPQENEVFDFLYYE